MNEATKQGPIVVGRFTEALSGTIGIPMSERLPGQIFQSTAQSTFDESEG